MLVQLKNTVFNAVLERVKLVMVWDEEKADIDFMSSQESETYLNHGGENYQTVAINDPLIK